MPKHFSFVSYEPKIQMFFLDGAVFRTDTVLIYINFSFALKIM